MTLLRAAVQAGHATRGHFAADVLRDAWSRVNGRTLMVTVAIAAALQLWLAFEARYGRQADNPMASGYVSASLMNAVMVLCLMCTTLIADALAARGARRLTTYAGSVVAGCALGTLVEAQLHAWLRLTRYSEVPTMTFLEYLTWGSVIVFVYVNRRDALRAAARLAQAQVQRTQAQRHALEAKLQTLQARVDPQLLFGTLARVAGLYERDAAAGARLLDSLIVYLRAALPRERESGTTLDREIGLACAYASLLTLPDGTAADVAIDVARPLRAAAMPAMVLLPLVHGMLARGHAAASCPGTLRIAARSVAGWLQVTLAGASMSDPRDAEDTRRVITDRLQRLYGPAATVTFVPLPGGRMEWLVEVPDVAADGDHR